MLRGKKAQGVMEYVVILTAIVAVIVWATLNVFNVNSGSGANKGLQLLFEKASNNINSSDNITVAVPAK